MTEPMSIPINSKVVLFENTDFGDGYEGCGQTVLVVEKKLFGEFLLYKIRLFEEDEEFNLNGREAWVPRWKFETIDREHIRPDEWSFYGL